MAACPTILVAAVISFVFLARSSQALQDFDNTVHGDFEFIFHDNHDLLLVIHNDDCYFMDVDDEQQEMVWANHTDRLMEHVYRMIVYDSPKRVSNTSLDEMRTKYGDILADFHCKDKNIFSAHIRDYYDMMVANITHNNHDYSHHHHHHQGGRDNPQTDQPPTDSPSNSHSGHRHQSDPAEASPPDQGYDPYSDHHHGTHTGHHQEPQADHMHDGGW